jgi:endonuclease III
VTSKAEPGLFDQFAHDSSARRSPCKRAQVSYEDNYASVDELDLTDLEDVATPPRSSVKKKALTRTLVKRTRKTADPVQVKEEVSVTEGGKSRGKMKVQRKPKKIPSKLEIPHPAPDNWEEAYGMIKEMRKREVAPVDTMGCQLAGKDEANPKVLNLLLQR